MAFVQYLICGSRHTSVTSFRRDAFSKESQPVTINNGRNAFEGKISSAEDNGQIKTVIIDNVVKIQTLSDSIFQNAKHAWSNLRAKSTLIAAVTCLGGVAAIISAAALGIILPPLFAVAITVGVVGLALLSCGILSSVRSQEAYEQKNAWQNAVQKAQSERIRIGNSGFRYVQKNQCKGSLISQAETEDLWHKDLASLKQKFHQSENADVHTQAKLIKDFFDNGPIQSGALSYAFENIPEQYSTNSTSYYDLAMRYYKIARQAMEKQSLVYTEQTQQINQIAAVTAQNSMMIEGMRDLGPYHHPQRSMVNAAAGAFEVANSLGSLAAITANDAQAKRKISEIQSAEAQELSSLFTEVKKLLNNYPD